MTHTSTHICETCSISRTRLADFTNGRQVRRNGRVEWTEPALLEEGTDYTRTFQKRRAVVLYADSAIEKIKQRVDVPITTDF